MKLAIMQPYFFPYIGYFQLINSVDKFVIYDNIQYTKKGWINRNKYLQNGKEKLFTVPLKGDSDFLEIKDRYIADCFDRKKLITQFKLSYFKSPQFSNVMPLLENCILYKETNLFSYILFSVKKVCEYLHINTEIIISSDINTSNELKGKERIIDICEKLNASIYINPIGGLELYSKNDFENNGIILKFLKSDMIKYNQLNNDFVPWLSIIDVMMFNSVEDILKLLEMYNYI